MLDSIIGLLIVVPLVVMIVWFGSIAWGGQLENRDVSGELNRLADWMRIGGSEPLIFNVERGQLFALTRYRSDDDTIVNLCGGDAAPLETVCSQGNLCMCMFSDGRTWCVESDRDYGITSSEVSDEGCIFLEGPVAAELSIEDSTIVSSE